MRERFARAAGWVAATLLGTVGPAAAGTITVTIGSSDPIDFPTTGTIADLPGPDGKVSFSEAMIAANNTPGPDTIAFAIPQSDWTFQWLYPGRAVVYSSNSFYWRAYEAVTIDGTTQTAFTGDTNPGGAEVVLWSHPYLNADDCVVRGLDSSQLSLTESGGLVEDCSGTMGIEVFGGSGSVIRRCTGGGYCQIDRSSDNVVVGCTFQRVRVLGWIANGQPAANNRIGGPAPEDRNFITGLGTWNSEGWPSGFAVQLFNAVGTVIENNRIGTTPDGLAQGHAATIHGIWFDSENHDTTIRDNRIAGILGRGIGPHFFGVLGSGITLDGAGSGVVITGNTIGLDANDEPVLGSVTGIWAGSNYTWYAPMTDVRIGGGLPGEGNEIAGHLGNGITVARYGQDVRIAGNSIHSNQGMGIDLVDAAFAQGVTANDPLDGDDGANGLQNFPGIASATGDGANVQVTGSLGSTPSAPFTIDFFASPGCDANGFGEGQLYLGSTTVSTDGAGSAAFDVVLPASVVDGWVVTATAQREPLGATSEFSACVPVVGGATAVAQVSGGGGTGPAARLLSCAPNPFSLSTTFWYELREEQAARLTICDVAGRVVRVLVDGAQPAGTRSVEWDGRSDDGTAVARGVYFYQLRAGDERSSGRVVLVR